MAKTRKKRPLLRAALLLAAVAVIGTLFSPIGCGNCNTP
mgnify:CR=1 FL=1